MIMATIKQRGKNWQLNYVDARGDRHQPTVKGSREDAEAELRKRLYEVDSDKIHGYTKTIEFREYAHKYQNWFQAHFPSSWEGVESAFRLHLEPFFKGKKLHEIDNDMVDDFCVFERRNGAASASVNKRQTILRAMFNKAATQKYRVNEDLKIKDVADLVSKPPKYHKLDKLQDIYDADPIHRHWWKLLANTGMRLGEFRNLKWSDIDDETLNVVSTDCRRTKSGNWRPIKLNAAALEALSHFDRSGRYVMPRLHKDVAKTALRRACIRAGIDKGKWGVHCLRHTFASHLVMAAVPMRAVQKLLGHASIKTTEIYAHLSPEYLSDTTSQISL